jgi:hypothetical protein
MTKPHDDKLEDINTLSPDVRRIIIRANLLHNATEWIESTSLRPPLFLRDPVKDNPALKAEILRLCEQFVDMVLLKDQILQAEKLNKSFDESVLTKSFVEIALWCQHADHCLKPYTHTEQNSADESLHTGTLARLAAVTAVQIIGNRSPIGLISDAPIDRIANLYLESMGIINVSEEKLKEAEDFLKERVADADKKWIHRSNESARKQSLG